MKLSNIYEVTEKSFDPEKQALWERFYKQYDKITVSLSPIVNDLRDNVEEQREYRTGKDYLDKITNYYKRIERLIIHDESTQTIEDAIKESEKLMQSISNFINRHLNSQSVYNFISRNLNRNQKIQPENDSNTWKNLIGAEAFAELGVIDEDLTQSSIENYALFKRSITESLSIEEAFKELNSNLRDDFENIDTY